MKESLDNIYSPDANKELPVEETAAFEDWVAAQRELPEEEQSLRYKELVEKAVARGEDLLVDERARQRIRELREKSRKTGI